MDRMFFIQREYGEGTRRGRSVQAFTIYRMGSSDGSENLCENSNLSVAKSTGFEEITFICTAEDLQIYFTNSCGWGQAVI